MRQCRAEGRTPRRDPNEHTHVTFPPRWERVGRRAASAALDPVAAVGSRRIVRDSRTFGNRKNGQSPKGLSTGTQTPRACPSERRRRVRRGENRQGREKRRRRSEAGVESRDEESGPSRTAHGRFLRETTGQQGHGSTVSAYRGFRSNERRHRGVPGRPPDVHFRVRPDTRTMADVLPPGSSEPGESRSPAGMWPVDSQEVERPLQSSASGPPHPSGCRGSQTPAG
jgi:hypothetical protein